jgi:hypothetical protein
LNTCLPGFETNLSNVLSDRDLKQFLMMNDLGDEVVDAALARQEAANPFMQPPAEVLGKKTRCSSCLAEREGARAKNSLKKVKAAWLLLSLS